jgi:CheY-like chemotaxis protein
MTIEQAQRTVTGRPTVLLVDDEEDILTSLSLQLRKDHKVLTAVSGADALRVLAENGPVAAVISDLRMPEMDGIELLKRVQLEYPDTTRVLHTAQNDVGSAISAINTGGVYRYLAKPVTAEQLRGTVHEAVALNGRSTAERELLDKTLKTSIQALFGCLELASPIAFARAGRIRTLVAEICSAMQLDALWEIEVAAMASQLGAVTVPPSVLAKLDKGLPCTEEEQLMLDAMPGVAVQLLKNIPMLGDVVEIVRGLTAFTNHNRPENPSSPLIEAAIDVIRTAIDFETLESRGLERESGIAVLECRTDAPMAVLTALRKLKGCVQVKEKVRGLRVVDLEVGMRVAEDIVATNTLVLIGRGMIVTDLLLDRLHNFSKIIEIVEPVLAVPGARRV